MKELIKARIETMKDPIQKVMLQDVLKDVFRIIMDYSEDCFKELEAKIDAELIEKDDKYGIYMGVCKKEGLDGTGSFLFEVDTQQQEINTGVLKTIFLACDHQTICKCLDKTFSAEVETEDHTYHIQVALRYSKKYLSKIEWLYQQFLANKREWHTINCPYLYKFLDVVDIGQAIPSDETVERVVLDLEGLGKYMCPDMVLVWNIKELDVKTGAKIVPGDKKVLYEHKIGLPNKEAGHLVSIGEPETFYTIYNEEYLLVRSEHREYESLKLLEIAPFDLEKENTKLSYPLHTNRRVESHVDRLAARQPRLLLTEGELRRILGGYEAYEPFQLETVILEEASDTKGMDCNPFILAHNFLGKRRVLHFFFRCKDMENIRSYEEMCFLVSEIQFYTEEYQCVGSLRGICMPAKAGSWEHR